MATSGCNDTDAEKTEVESLQVLRPLGSQGGGTEGLPYLYHRPMHKGLAKADDDYVTEAFKQLPMPDQEKLIEELSNQLHQDVMVEKLFDESTLVSGTIVSRICEGFGQQIVQHIFEGIVGGSEESSLTLEFFKVKNLILIPSLKEPSSVARIDDLSEALYVEVQGDQESIKIYCKETSQDR
ncbi:hypothetical protein POTOM_017923 [Populus tomentosa]|uniref:Uncharacterized protein n=1 Tax=Populus tomentosa TaxID=118781 RepID=A0A8X7ZVS3_POPTO|nr:hypothetical protein POTOM_017923 [Populus tomentosa]